VWATVASLDSATQATVSTFDGTDLVMTDAAAE
jgi:hypothetical protein